jgi:acetolactate synthase-1/2/3 large subunit
MADDLAGKPASVTAPSLTSAQALVQCLALNGVNRVFLVPGESYLAVIDALFDVRDRIEVITCRHEAAAANMAVAHARLTGRPGVVMVTRGPGATHASIGIHNAEQDSAPVLLFVGQIAAGHRGRAAFQEIDYGQMFGGIAKLALEITHADRTVELVNRALITAQTGRKGPVVISLPEDVLEEDCGSYQPVALTIARAEFPAHVLEPIRQKLAAAKRPLVILGGVGWTQEACDSLRAWAEALNLPVALSFRRKDLIDNNSRVYVGDLALGPNPKLIAWTKRADMLLVIGARLGENPSQAFTLFTPNQTAQIMAHIHPGLEELGRVWPVAVAAVSEPPEAVAALTSLELRPFDDAWRAEARADYEAFAAPIPAGGPVNMSEIVEYLSGAAAADAIICNGAGNFAAWLGRFYKHRRVHTQLAPISGGMGFGFPAAVGAKLAFPEREVICFCGDGDFLMCGQDLATAMRYGVNFVTVVLDNGAYGTIRMHQERDYPDRIIATGLTNPDFAAYARSFGAWAATVERTADFAPAYEEARAAGRPALIHVKVDLEDISPGKTLKSIHGTGVVKP